MTALSNTSVLRLCLGIISLFASTTGLVSAQSSPKPYLQPITVQSEKRSTTTPAPTPTPYVKKTGSVTLARPIPDIITPSEMAIPGNSGVLVETLEGKVVRESYSNYAFNPASNVKVATAYAVLKTFGPDYRFPTNVFTDGELDRSTGTLNGNLYISGRDPSFTLDNAVAVAEALNRNGIRSVTGDLIVTDKFVMEYSNSTASSANLMFTNLDSGKRSARATRDWQNYLTMSGKAGQLASFPSVSFSGKVYVDIIPSNAKMLFAHESAPLREIVKVMMCYSNNYLAERLGDMLGGAYAVARIVQLNAGIPPEQFILQTSSGLGVNRVTPQAMMKLLRTFRNDLSKFKMTFADVMPVAGVDEGTLKKRLNTYGTLGSVIGKTGTLGNTDGGASSLAGEMQTRQGKILFVIFNQHGSNARFRNFQDSFLTGIQNQFGGALAYGHALPTLEMRMALTRITYPDSRARRN